MKTTLLRIFVLMISLFGLIHQPDVIERSGFAASQTNVTVEGNTLKINGQPARLISYSDIGALAESSFDYGNFFNTLRGYKINSVRVWVNYHWANSLTPYAGSFGSYDIGQQSNAFYTRLANFVREADRHGIVVQLCLFDANALETGADDRYNQRWVRSPLNKANNRNSYLTARSKYFTTDATCNSSVDRDRCIWSRVHSVLIDKVTEQTGNYGNVIYEIMNEPDGSNTGASSASVRDFHQAVIQRLSSKLRNYSGSKVISINADSSTLKRLAKDDPAVSMYSVHLSKNNRPASADLSAVKPVIISNDGHCTQTAINYKSGHANRDTSCSGAVSSGEAQVRANKTEDLLRRVFPSTSMTGRVHFDFLDKGINGSSWPTTQNYNPRAGNFDRLVLEKLKSFAR